MRGNLLVLGAGGFVGPWVVRDALVDGWSVTGAARGATADYGPGYQHIVLDATDIAACAPLVSRADAVVYNAAHIPANFEDPAEAEACLRVNAKAPLAILGLLTERPRPFVYISSAQGYKVDREPVSENDQVFPSGHAAYYLASKLLGDIYTEHYRLVHRVPTAVLRLGSLYGPGLRRGMVSRFVCNARTGEKIVLQNGGRHQADLTFVGDVGGAAVEVLRRRATGIFNIGSGQATSALEAARHVIAAAGQSAEILKIEAEVGGASPSGFALLDITRARTELGYVPTMSPVGLDRTVREWR